MHCMNEHGCGHHGHGGHAAPAHHPAGCCCTEKHGFRRFPNREEQLSSLEEYLEQLKAETKGVEERIAGLKKEQQ